MNKFVLAAWMALTLTLAGPAWAEEKPSCDDLTEMANALDEVANAMEAQGQIRENSADDKSLKELVDALKVVARVESNSKLAATVATLESSWQKMNWTDFVANLDETTAIFDALYTLECPH